MATKAHLEGNKRYLEKQDNIQIRVPKGQKEILQRYAEDHNLSLNQLFVTAVMEKMERDKNGE